MEVHSKMALWRRPLDTYRGMHMGCAPGTHEMLYELVARHARSRKAALDCGCRSGAMLSRLRDNGFQYVCGIDLDTEVLVPDDIDVLLTDLNADFSRHFDRKFDLVTCTEVMEHLNSPRAFITEARKLLEDDGILALSVPNIAFWIGRVKFALSGEHWGYGERYYREARHISPTTVQELTCLLREVGFEVLDVKTAGSFSGPLRKLVHWPVETVLRAVLGPTVRGESLVIVARKAPAEKSLSQPDLYHSSWVRSRASSPDRPNVRQG